MSRSGNTTRRPKAIQKKTTDCVFHSIIPRYQVNCTLLPHVVVRWRTNLSFKYERPSRLAIWEAAASGPRNQNRNHFQTVINESRPSNETREWLISILQEASTKHQHAWQSAAEAAAQLGGRGEFHQLSCSKLRLPSTARRILHRNDTCRFTKAFAFTANFACCLPPSAVSIA